MKIYAIDDRFKLGLLLNDLNLVNIGAEIGVGRGEYSKILLNTWKGKKLYLIDIWKHQDFGYYDVFNVSDEQHEQHYKLMLQNVKEFSGRYEIIRKFSVSAAKMFDNDSLDFIYLDANHNYNAVMEDLNAWYPKVKSGGILSGHDFLDTGGLDFGVKSAVTEFITNKQVKLFIINEPWPTWYFEKTE